jgi:hypothetical protein
MSAAELEAWSKTALDFLGQALRERNWPVRFELVRAGGKPRNSLRRSRHATVRNALEHEGGAL